MIDAKWLFQNHMRQKALEKYLESQILYFDLSIQQEEKEEIESKSLARPELGMVISHTRQGSSTEHIAIEIEEKRQKWQKDRQKDYQETQRACHFLLALYDAVMIYLLPKEAWLVDKIYNQGLSLSRISELPDCPYGLCNRSTLCRQRQKVEDKANGFIQAYVSEEVDLCQLKKYSADLKI